MQKMLWIAGLLLTLLLGVTWQTAQAASGLPDSPQFGYGVRVRLVGQTAETLAQPIQTAARSGLDWIALDFDWAAQATNPGEINLATFDSVMGLAAQNGLHVLISITNPPAWSLSASGPNPENVAALSTVLARQYAGTLLAIELFPAANTTQGWGAVPDPVAYARLLQSTRAAIQSAQADVTLIAAGLTLLSANPAPGDMDDLVFLAGLYEAGGREDMPVISVRLPALSGDPLTSPTADGLPCLRHFEAVRQMMLDHNHAQGLIWISGFAWPSDFSDAQAQADWLVQAYELLQARLYLGAAFFDELNASNGGPTLASPDGSPHLGLLHLAQLINTRRAAASGQPSNILKQILFRPNFKPQESR